MTAFARQLAFQTNPDDPRHGTDNGYANLYCRCAACTEAHRQVHTEWRARKRRQIAPETVE